MPDVDWRAEIGDGCPHQHEHRDEHNEGLGRIGPDGGADAATVTVHQHQPRTDDGSGRNVPAEQYVQCLAASRELGGGISAEEQDGQNTGDASQQVEFCVVPLGQ